MTDRSIVIAVDQGTSSTKAVAMDETGAIVGRASVPIGQENPQPGWIQQDSAEILGSVHASIAKLVADCDAPVAAIGISNQRESALAWDTATGEPLGPLLGWQDRRTIAAAQELNARGLAPIIRERSGLPLDPMFSALKFAWLLDQIDPDRSRARAGKITLGTVDAWLVQRLTGDRRIETGNASRTQLLNIRTADWDPELLDIFNIPAAALPPLVASDAPSAPLREAPAALKGVRIQGVLGDSHAALFAHGVRGPGQVKVTYGTGSSIMGLAAGDVEPASGMVETIGWHLASSTAPARAFEGNILSIGSTLLWTAAALGCDTDELDRLAQSVPDNAGVFLVPAFSGLGAPYWDESAVSTLVGFGPGNGRAHLARAAFESIPLQIEDVLERADAVSGVRIATVLTDGGPTRNDWLMQRQADLSARDVARPVVAELSVSGAAHLAGMSAGLWTPDDVAALPRERTTFTPAGGGDAARDHVRTGWASAVARSRAQVSPRKLGVVRDRAEPDESADERKRGVARDGRSA